MRSLLTCTALAATAGCGPAPELHAVTPDQGWALGGEPIEVLGRGLDEDLTVFFGDLPAVEHERIDDEHLIAHPERGVAGAVDVTLRDAEGEVLAALPDAYRYLALDLQFVQADAGFLPSTQGLIDGAIGDLDGDGIDDLVVLTQDGMLSWWRGTGAGTLTDEGPLQDDVAALALADLDGDGHLDLATCAGGSEAPRVLYGDGQGGLVDEPGGLPLLAGRCDDLAVLSGARPTLAVLRRAGAGSVVHVLRSARAEQPRGLVQRGEPEPGPCPVTGDATCTVAPSEEGGIAATLAVTGTASLRADVDVRGEPLTLEVLLREAVGVAVSATLIDAQGERFSTLLDTTTPVAAARDPASWDHDGDGVVDLPVQSAGIGLDGEGTATLTQVRLRTRGGGRTLLFDAAPIPPSVQLDQRHHHLALIDTRGADTVDVIVGDASAAGGVRLFTEGQTGWDRAAPTRLDAPSCGVGGLHAGALTAGPGPDLIVLCRGAQDRLFVNDGSGRFFDDTARALPVDGRDSAGITLADLDLDGVPELLIASRDGVDRLYGSVDDRWVDRTARLGLDVRDTRRLLAVDVDRDGDLDVVALGPAGAELFVAVPPGPRAD